MKAFWNHRLPGDRQHIGRNHRVAEALALCMAAGVEIRPYALPALQKNIIRQTAPNSPSFYIARDFKKIGGDNTNKTAFTRIAGALFCQGNVYAVYNTQNAIMKWSGLGEIKTVGNLLELARMNAGLDTVNAALLLGKSGEVALNTVLESDQVS